jgi:hypothetical protein
MLPLLEFFENHASHSQQPWVEVQNKQIIKQHTIN